MLPGLKNVFKSSKISSALVPNIKNDCSLNNFTDIGYAMGTICRRSPPEVLLRKGVLKICSKCTEKYPLPKCDFNKEVTKQLY